MPHWLEYRTFAVNMVCNTNNKTIPTMKTFAKRLFLGMMVLPFSALWSCNDPSSKLPETPLVTVSEQEVFFTENGGEYTVSFSTNRTWCAELINNLDSNKEPWCTLSAESGEAGNNHLTIQALSLEGDYREAVLILNASASGQEILIKQSGQPVITTADAIEVDEAHATLGGSWHYSGEIEVQEFGIELRENTSEQVATYIINELDENGAFSLRVEKLLAETSYTYCVYLLTRDGIFYQGEQKSFTTDRIPERISIAELKAMGRQVAAGGQQKLTESQYVEGVVVDSFVPVLPEENPSVDETEARGLLPSEAYVIIMDDTKPNSGITMRFPIAEQNTYSEGDRLVVRTKDGVISHAASGLVDFVPAPIGVHVAAEGEMITPAVADHTLLADYESMVVSIDNTQLTRLFTDKNAYPLWGSTQLWNMEVEGSELSYTLYVPADSPLAAIETMSGSGSVQGVVINDESIGYAVKATKSSDVADLTADRFDSLLELKFFAPEVQGTLCVGEESSAQLVIPYRNGDNSILEGTISVVISGDEAVVGDLAVESLVDYQIGMGLGEIVLAITGSPGAAGSLIFTVEGLKALGSSNFCTAEVVAPAAPEVGNFEAVWNTNTAKGDSEMKLLSNTNEAIGVSNWILTATSSNITGTKWADFAAVGWDANTADNYLTSPVQYFQVTVTVGSGKKLVLSGWDLQHRINGGDVTLSVQYSINEGKFMEIEQRLMTSESGAITLNLGKVEALTNLVEGTTLTLRLVPMATSASIKWGIKKGERFALYGNVE